MNNKYKTKKIVIMAIFVSMGLVLQYVESRILISPIPGGKLGLANIVTILNIFLFGGWNAVLIATLRAILGAFMFGGAATLMYSLSGAFFSVTAMIIAKRLWFPKISIIGLSIIGAVVHNISQTMVAYIQYGSVYVFSYVSGLLIISLVSGVITGYATDVFAKRVLKGDFA